MSGTGGSQGKFSEIADSLISGLFQNAETEGSSVEFDENASLTLTFMFPECYLKALEILDNRGVCIHVYGDDDGGEFNFERAGNDHIILVRDQSDKSVLVDLQQWFCSCEDYVTKLKMSHIVQRGTDMGSGGGGFGYRSQLPQLTNINRNSVPVCKHLLSVYILARHSEVLSNAYTVKKATLDDWLRLHASI